MNVKLELTVAQTKDDLDALTGGKEGRSAIKPQFLPCRSGSRCPVRLAGIVLNRKPSGTGSFLPFGEPKFGDSNTRLCLSHKGAEKYQHKEDGHAANAREDRRPHHARLRARQGPRSRPKVICELSEM
jgi:hypothetical protein